jgi:uncharacterized protein
MRILGLVVLTFLIFGCAAETTERSEQPRTTTASGMETTAKAAKTARAPRLRTVTIDPSGGGEVRLRVEIADDASEIARGLMYRTALAENRGMLFVYGAEYKLSFWMKNTLIPLSIAFMDAEGRIVDIQDMKPLDDDPPSYVSAKPAQYALEVNQGFFEERGVEVGDRAELPVKP